jgi:hypothetical protein
VAQGRKSAGGQGPVQEFARRAAISGAGARSQGLAQPAAKR